MENYKFGKDYITCHFLPTSFLHQIIYILWLFFFSAPMEATELLCSSLGEQAKHWGQVEHAQFCKASKGSGLGFVFVWGKSCSLHMVTTVRHKQTWGSKPHHAHAAFSDTNWRESGKEKEIYHSYTIYPLAVWLFFSPYCK